MVDFLFHCPPARGERGGEEGRQRSVRASRGVVVCGSVGDVQALLSNLVGCRGALVSWVGCEECCWKRVVLVAS